jgi:hypothetical protein
MLKFRLLFKGLCVIAALSVCSVWGQETIQAGAVRLTFPSAGWKNTLSPSKNNGKGTNGSQMLLSAENSQGNLHAHVTHFNYPDRVSELQMASFAELLFGNYKSGVISTPTETSGAWSGFPLIEREFHYRGWVFMTARIIFCESGAYLVEFGGAGEKKQEAALCWETMSINGEKPLSSALFEKMSQVRQSAKESVAKPQKTKSEYWFLALLVAGFIAFFAVLGACVWVVQKSRSKELGRIIRRLRYGRRRSH